MTDIWIQHARTSGRRAVINPDISEEEFDRVTREQEPVLGGILWPYRQVVRYPCLILDYGCGPGRFVPLLHQVFVPPCSITAYDPCREYGAFMPLNPGCMFISDPPPRGIYDLVFVWLVLGGIPDDGAPKVTDEIVSCLAPGGLLIFGDHCEWQKQEGKWWAFRQPATYEMLFAARGVTLAKIGDCPQLENTVTVFAGRKA